MLAQHEEVTERVYHYLFASISFWGETALKEEMMHHLGLTRVQVEAALAKLEQSGRVHPNSTMPTGYTVESAPPAA